MSIVQNPIDIAGEEDPQPPGEIPPDIVTDIYFVVPPSTRLEQKSAHYLVVPYGEYQRLYEGMFDDEPHIADQDQGPREQETPHSPFPNNSDYSI